MKTPLEQLEFWIGQYQKINGTPSLKEIKGQINLLKDYEAGQHETIINCNISEMQRIADIASEEKERKYSLYEFHETPQKFSTGDIRIVLQSLKKVKCN